VGVDAPDDATNLRRQIIARARARHANARSISRSTQKTSRELRESSCIRP
jgi:hypothetical protein